MKQSTPTKRRRATTRPSALHEDLHDHTTQYVVDYMDHAPVWQGPIFAPGLFRPTQNGATVQPQETHFTSKVLDWEMEYRVVSPEPLNITDQAIFFHICQRIAAGEYILQTDKDERFEAYRDALGVTGLWSAKPMAVVKLTPSDLAAGIGLTRTGTNAQTMLASLNRLSRVNMDRKLMNANGTAGTSRFLAFLCFDDEVRVVLNFESTVLAHHRKGVAWINMREHRRLPSKPAKRLHAWLSAWAPSRSRKLVGLDTLMHNVWGGSPATPGIRKDRKRTLRKALADIASLPGWSCAYTEKGDQLLVRKPAFAGTKAQKGKPVTISKMRHAVATTTKAADSPTDDVGTPSLVAGTPTATSPNAAPSIESNGLLFSL